MFGLMRAKKCGLSQEERQFRRLNYCGTCKTLGSIYSAKARLLLNHDVVFLAELLSCLGGEDGGDWQRPYQSFNCLSLPKEHIPASLEWAATANVILTEFKIRDHVTDGEGMRFRAAGRVFSKDFATAERIVRGWGFPLEEVRNALDSQETRESEAVSLDDLAFPTARATALFFQHGVRHIGRSDLETSAYEIGSAFGKLVYFIDAFEDYERDIRRHRFNAFRAYYRLDGDSIPSEVRREITVLIGDVETSIAERIQALPITERQSAIFVSRLSENLGRKLGKNLPVLITAHICKPRRSFRGRWRQASEKARSLAGSYSWQMPLVFVFVFIFALVAPAAHAREARSVRECFDLGFNMMFLGAVFGSVVALPKKLLMESPDLGQNVAAEAAKEAAKHAGKGPKGGGGCCSCGDCDCCCDCDCCDSCGDCGSCCDCCSCDC